MTVGRLSVHWIESDPQRPVVWTCRRMGGVLRTFIVGRVEMRWLKRRRR